MADPAYPDVPFAPGVPPVLRTIPPAGTVPPTVDALTKDAPGLTDGSLVRWGVFSQKGTLALEPDSITAVEYQREFRIPDYPIEQGGFESYNKVATPYDLRVTMTKGGKLSERKAFLDQVELILASLDLFTIITPERSYPNVNMVRTDYRRNAVNGATLLTVELQAIEIRAGVSVQFSAGTPGQQIVGFATNRDGTQVPIFGAVHSASGADPINNGSVQPRTPAQAPRPEVIGM